MAIEQPDQEESKRQDVILEATHTIGPDQHRRWNILVTNGGTFDRLNQESSDGTLWTDEVRFGPFATWQDAVMDDPVLTQLRAGSSATFDIDGIQDQLVLASLLRCEVPDDLGEVGWPEGEVGMVGQNKIFFLPRPDTAELVAILGCGDELPDDECEILGDLLAEYRWSDDYFPMSTSYTSFLIEFTPGLSLLFPIGDLIFVAPTVIVLTDLLERRADGIIDWLGNMGGAYSAAVLALEPLDPDNHLTAERTHEWESALEDDRYSLGFWLDHGTDHALRTKLAEDSTYRYIRQALAEPLSENGRTVYTELTEGDILIERY